MKGAVIKYVMGEEYLGGIKNGAEAAKKSERGIIFFFLIFAWGAITIINIL